ncbi:MAG TPA: OFA family MFS transporter [Candidatus Cloacimonadota bacterium]|nr:OFA family MFS transporter [Candidatus Cloacimonadota bacterium]HOH78475.1 OFA family MFS transporter [Candidatus Cloacimonadota bacterium]
MSRFRKLYDSRWSVVLGGFLVALMGGLSYSWGVFVEVLKQDYGWSKMISTLPLSVFMVVFAIVMIPGGRLQEKISPGRQIRIGAFFFLAANLLSSLVVKFPHKWWLLFSYGLIGGIGCGLSYSCIAPAIRRWFPDHPGLAVSLGVMGFGLAAFFFAPLKANFMLPSYGLHGTFIILAIVTFTITWLASWLIRFPSEWHLHLFGTVHLSGDDSMILANVGPREMIRKPLFWLTWSAFLMVVYGSLLTIGILPSYGQTVVRLTGLQAAIPLSLFSLVNGLSRPVIGYVSDKLGTLKVMSVVFLAQSLVFLLFPSHVTTYGPLLAASVILGFGIASSLALFPVLTSEFFGVEHMGINYGILFSAYGFGAIAIQAGTYLHDLTGSYTPALLMAGVTSLIGTLIMIYIRKTYKVS